MVDLEKQSGLPIYLDGEELKAKEGFDLPEPDFRKLDDMKEVLMEGSELTGPEVLYSMYRGACKDTDKDLYKKYNQRYDITVIKSGPVGKEFIKTVGHYHSKKEDTDVVYPEIYEVIYGKAHFLLQKIRPTVIPAKPGIQDIKIIEAFEGDKFVIPPDYGHVTINPTNETLVISNIQCPLSVSSYEEYARLHGASFYETSEGEWVKNENYENEFEPKVFNASELKNPFGVSTEKSLYADFIDNPEKYDFLTNPEDYIEGFENLI